MSSSYGVYEVREVINVPVEDNDVFDLREA